MATRLLGIQIANGYSPEARVYAGLLAHSDAAQVKGQTLYHEWSGDRRSATQFHEATTTPVHRLDFGWRSVASDRSLGEKARARLQFLASLPRALALVRRLNPDVVYSCQQQWDCQAATYFARKLGKPQIIHLHYVVGPWLHKPVLDRLRTCDHVIAISDFIRAEALRHGVAPGRVTTIRNTIAVPPPESGTRDVVRRELGIAPEAPLLGIVARLDPDKGQADTIRAFASVAQAHPGAILLVVGNETPWHHGYSEELRTLAANCGVGERTHFLGRRSDVPRLLAALDVFVHPSRQEPFGLSVAEASAAGLPVVAYAEGGTGEVVEDGVTGWLAPPGDVPALAERLAAALADSGQARRMGAAGRQRMATQFRPDASGTAFCQLLQTAFGGSR